MSASLLCLKLIRRIGCGFIFIMWTEIQLFYLFSCMSAGWRPVWSGDELHHPGAREHRVHGGAAGQVRIHLSGGGLEHLHRHPQEERPQPAGVHRSGAHPASAGARLHNWQHDCRWKSPLLSWVRGGSDADPRRPLGNQPPSRLGARWDASQAAMFITASLVFSVCCPSAN